MKDGRKVVESALEELRQCYCYKRVRLKEESGQDDYPNVD